VRNILESYLHNFFLKRIMILQSNKGIAKLHQLNKIFGKNFKEYNKFIQIVERKSNRHSKR